MDNFSVLDVIGNTPIVKLQNLAPDIKSEIYLKLEFLNPGGSIKDRIGKYILQEAFKKGDIKKGATIIEATSGNTGVGLAMFAAIHGFKCIFVLADKQSPEKISNLRAFGAKVIVCPTNVDPDDPRSYYSVAKKLAENIPNSYYVNQYHNDLNPETHYHTTGPEILEQTKGEFDIFMAGVGTGGTISGTGMFLKEKMKNIKIVGVDIEGSILAHYHKTGEICEAKPYVLEGIGEDILPGNVKFKVIDDFVMVDDKESFLTTRALLTKEGIFAGGSSGAAVAGAIKYAKSLKEPKKILVILPDSGNRYTSKIFNDDWMRDNGYNDYSFNVLISEVIKEHKEVVTLDDKKTIGDAVKLMNDHGFSQIPIVSGTEVLGVVDEKNLLRPLFEGKLQTNENITLAMNTNFEVVELSEMISNVADALLEKKTVIVSDHGKILSILTDIDLLRFVHSKGKFNEVK